MPGYTFFGIRKRVLRFQKICAMMIQISIYRFSEAKNVLQMPGTRLWPWKADRETLALTESVSQRKEAIREHWGADIPNLRDSSRGIRGIHVTGSGIPQM